MDPKSIKNGALGGHGAAKGRLCPPLCSIWRVPKIGRFLKAPWVAKKSMDVSLGAARGGKKRPGGRARDTSLAKWLLGLASRARQGLIKINQ